MKHSNDEHSPFNATISALNAAASVLGTATLALVRSFRRYWHRVSGIISVGITPQMCNRVTNHNKSLRYWYFFQTGLNGD